HESSTTAVISGGAWETTSSQILVQRKSTGTVPQRLLGMQQRRCLTFLYWDDRRVSPAVPSWSWPERAFVEDRLENRLEIRQFAFQCREGEDADVFAGARVELPLGDSFAVGGKVPKIEANA